MWLDLGVIRSIYFGYILIYCTQLRLKLVSCKEINFSLVPSAGLKAQAPRSDFCICQPDHGARTYTGF